MSETHVGYPFPPLDAYAITPDDVGLVAIIVQGAIILSFIAYVLITKFKTWRDAKKNR